MRQSNGKLNIPNTRHPANPRRTFVMLYSIHNGVDEPFKRIRKIDDISYALCLVRKRLMKDAMYYYINNIANISLEMKDIQLVIFTISIIRRYAIVLE